MIKLIENKYKNNNYNCSLPYNQITKIEGLNNTVSVIYLEHNNISKIEGLDNIIHLTKLDLSYNQLTKIEGLNNLVTLEQLNLSCNKITKIEGLDKLVNLKYLDLHDNNILKIENLDNLKNLKTLILPHNKITKIEGLNTVKNLELLHINNNEISKIEGLNNLVLLTDLILDNNNVTKIEGLNNLVNLQSLYITNNQITTIDPSILLLRRLRHIDYTVNPIEYIPIYIQRFLDNLTHRVLINNIYNNAQNVHDSAVQQSIQKSIINILKNTKNTNYYTLDNILLDDCLNEKTKEILTEYCSDKSVHSVLGISFEELLGPVWDRIKSHKESNEIKKILNIEMQDSECKCFTGRMSRLVNCLAGFYNDVEIKISDKSQISNIVILVKENLERDGNYSVELHQDLTRKEMTERGYEKEVIDEYVSYIE